MKKPELEEMQSIVDEFKDNEDQTRKSYACGLLESLSALKSDFSALSPSSRLPSEEICRVHLVDAQSCVDRSLNLIDATLEARDDNPIDLMLSFASLWPNPTTYAYISSILSPAIPGLWQRALITLGKFITLLQRAERCLYLVAKDDTQSLYQELSNCGRNNWDPELFPSWLLMEIENNFLIRPVQAEVAFEMMNPKSGANTVMQLNMGEGKSSVILPLLAASLADGNTLVRVVVLKSLTKQTGYLLSQRLGGLLNRRVYFVPLHRQSPSNEQAVKNLAAIYRDCVRNHGVLLVQPEHILSFRLLGIDKLCTGNLGLASKVMELQQWMQERCRDVLDESDEILDVRSQLIYTIGSQKLMDGQPHRWLIIQSVFDLVARHALSLQVEYPGSMEVHQLASGSYPSIRIIQQNLVETLLNRIILDIGRGQIPDVSFEHCKPAIRHSALFIIRGNGDNHSEARAWDLLSEKFDETFLNRLLLLRGLMHHRILLYALQGKRWNVNYGLDLSRCLMAVPYLAKGIPSPSSEFGHPDVAIALTCLSYYYTGLTRDQLLLCLNLLFKSTDPSLEYGRWAQSTTTLPAEMRHVEAINLDDKDQLWSVLHPHLKLNKCVIDFYLEQVVFPREAKEFPFKLSSSAWDIPLSTLR